MTIIYSSSSFCNIFYDWESSCRLQEKLSWPHVAWDRLYVVQACCKYCCGLILCCCYFCLLWL